MERRERYDPEDIEQLLGERGFDQLLEEERAYVLRHLSGADEYETMRALLLRMRAGSSGVDPIEADPVIRERVLDAFRSGHRPAWRIWLNSVGALLLPREASGYWRPALALAGLALLIVGGITVVRTMQLSERSRALAEKREEVVKTPQAGPLSEGSAAPAIDTALPALAAPTLPTPSTTEEILPNASPTGSSVEALAEPDLFAEDLDHDDLAKAKKVDDETGDKDAEFGSGSNDVRMTSSGAASSESTMFKNQEIAEANEEQPVLHEVVTARASKKERPRAYSQAETVIAATGRSLADDPAVLGLVSQGW